MSSYTRSIWQIFQLNWTSQSAKPEGIKGNNKNLLKVKKLVQCSGAHLFFSGWIYFNSFRNYFHSVFKDTLRGHLNFSVTLYCILQRKFYVIIFVTWWKQESIPHGCHRSRYQTLLEMGRLPSKLRTTR